ncbi:hypothetical protein PI124_g13265 [Phytophthora idaei]|nr:hypothetical protein PI125_g12942 [Phytophthora idaei]KAG3160634.1 hypothetical protein PI126_g6814 [Phytophthora idaei]KAG3241881.1 hypothetical protein PI124_g13265 [Phytophthora idaei]
MLSVAYALILDDVFSGYCCRPWRTAPLVDLVFSLVFAVLDCAPLPNSWVSFLLQQQNLALRLVLVKLDRGLRLDSTSMLLRDLALGSCVRAESLGLPSQLDD